MAKQPELESRTVVCPSSMSENSHELLTFIHQLNYTESFKRFELTDEEQRGIETGIMMDPTLSPVINGTGGLRAIEFGLPNDGKAALHISAFYCYLPEVSTVLLLDVVQTDELGSMTNEERSAFKDLFERVQEFGPEAWDS